MNALEMLEEGQNQPEFPRKQIRFEEIRADEDEDRISMLPDCLLVEILSRLPATKCAVKTSALSKRWKQIWTSVPILVFSHYDNSSADFVSFVDKTLTQHDQLKLKKFRVYTPYKHQFDSHVRNWIRYAIDCKVEVLDLILLCDNLPEFLLDQFFFINSCFTDLTLWGCIINPMRAISWKNLRSLYINEGYLDEDLIEDILSGSPVLETLTLNECYGFRRLNITSKSVKKLVIEGYTFPISDDDMYIELADVIEINAPNILSLLILDDLWLRKISLVNVSSLVEAELDYTKSEFFETTSKEDEEEMLKQLILDLRHVKQLKIGICCCMTLSRLEDKGFICPSNLKVSDDDMLESSDESDSDSDECTDDPTGDELQEPVDATTSSSREDDEADA